MIHAPLINYTGWWNPRNVTFCLTFLSQIRSKWFGAKVTGVYLHNTMLQSLSWKIPKLLGIYQVLENQEKTKKRKLDRQGMLVRSMHCELLEAVFTNRRKPSA